MYVNTGCQMTILLPYMSEALPMKRLGSHYIRVQANQAFLIGHWGSRSRDVLLMLSLLHLMET